MLRQSIGSRSCQGHAKVIQVKRSRSFKGQISKLPWVVYRKCMTVYSVILCFPELWNSPLGYTPEVGDSEEEVGEALQVEAGHGFNSADIS